MMIDRRLFLFSILGTALAACDGQAQSSGARVDGTTGLPPDLQPVANAGFDSWVAFIK